MRVVIITLLSLFVLFTASVNAITYPDIPSIEVASIYDGDTFRVNISSCMELFCSNIGVRVDGVDTPELKGRGITDCEKRAGKRVKEFTVGLLTAANKITLTNPQRGKYFRIVAGIRLEVQGKDLMQSGVKGSWEPDKLYTVDLGKLLMDNGHAYEYHGGTKKKFVCQE